MLLFLLLQLSSRFLKPGPALLSPSSPCQKSGVLALPQTILKLLSTSYFKIKKNKIACVIVVVCKAREVCKPGP